MSSPHSQHVELPIIGMACASCANQIERMLNKLEGVAATMNYATEKASVDYDPRPAWRGRVRRLPGSPSRR